MQGKIKKIVDEKPFGFIEVEGQTSDIFFHKDKVDGSFEDLRVGDEVTFETEQTDRNGEVRTSAINVKKV